MDSAATASTTVGIRMNFTVNTASELPIPGDGDGANGFVSSQQHISTFTLKVLSEVVIRFSVKAGAVYVQLEYAALAILAGGLPVL